jgi:hypothetical protein
MQDKQPTKEEKKVEVVRFSDKRDGPRSFHVTLWRCNCAWVGHDQGQTVAIAPLEFLSLDARSLLTRCQLFSVRAALSALSSQPISGGHPKLRRYQPGLEPINRMAATAFRPLPKKLLLRGNLRNKAEKASVTCPRAPLENCLSASLAERKGKTSRRKTSTYPHNVFFPLRWIYATNTSLPLHHFKTSA